MSTCVPSSLIYCLVLALLNQNGCNSQLEALKSETRMKLYMKTYAMLKSHYRLTHFYILSPCAVAIGMSLHVLV